MWNTHTDSHLFDVVEPKHPCAGGLTIDDVQRRIAQQVQDMHLDERFAVDREALGRNLAAGREKASTMFNKFYADMESYREAQRAKVEEQAAAAQSASANAAAAEKNGVTDHDASLAGGGGAKSTTYVGSWVSWAGEKRKGWGSGWGARKSDKSGASSPASALSPREEGASRFSGSSFFPARNAHGQATAAGAGQDEKRPVTGNSFSESIFSSAGTTDSAPGSPRGFRPEEFIPRDVTHGRPEDKTEAPAPAPAPHGAKDEIVAATPTLEPVVEKADVKSETVTSTPEKVDVVPVRKTEMATPASADEPVADVDVPSTAAKADMEPEVVTATGEVVSSAPAADGVKV
ncbi:hypothetical protein HYQ46_012446 [Verticillium longisporum]|nr:hypothetical protein HYQ46_012446 [Verticillium longisporum]